MARQIGLQLDPILNPGGASLLMKRGTIDFLELAYQEGIAQTIISNIPFYSDSKVYILWGCALSTGGGSTNIQEGALFYNREIFLTLGNTFISPTGGNVVVANLISTSWQPIDAIGNTYADPQEFIGVSNSNIHIIRTATFESGASGSGTISGTNASDFSNIINGVNPYSSSGLSLSSGWSNVAGYYPATFKIKDNNQVFLSGRIDNGAITGFPQSLLQLPSFCYPTIHLLQSILVDYGTGTNFSQISINTSGLISLLPNGSSTVVVGISLDGISFRIN